MKIPFLHYLKKIPKQEKKVIQIAFRAHNTNMYLLCDDGSIYVGDPDKHIEFTKIKGIDDVI